MSRRAWEQTLVIYLYSKIEPFFLNVLIPTTFSFCIFFQWLLLLFLMLLFVFFFFCRLQVLFLQEICLFMFSKVNSLFSLLLLFYSCYNFFFHSDTCTVSVLSKGFYIFPSSFNVSSSSKTLLFYILLQLITLISLLLLYFSKI